MANPEHDAIDSLFFTINNEKARYKHQKRFNLPFKNISGMIIVDPTNYQVLQTEKINLRTFYSNSFPLYYIIIIIVIIMFFKYRNS